MSTGRSTERLIGILLIATHAGAAIAVIPLVVFAVGMQFGVCSYRPDCSNTRLNLTIGAILAVTIAIILAEITAAVRAGRRHSRTVWIGPVGFVAHLVALAAVLGPLLPS